MSEYVVDTNVLLVATCFEIGAPPEQLRRRGEDVPVTRVADQEEVFAWLERLRKDPHGIIVLDEPEDQIQSEYRNKLSKKEYGRMVVAEKLTKGQVRWVTVDMDSDGHGVIPHGAADEVFDRADRKMVAAAVVSGAPIVNACDTDWLDLHESGALARLGVSVVHVIEPWCRAEWLRKKAARS